MVLPVRVGCENQIVHHCSCSWALFFECDRWWFIALKSQLNLNPPSYKHSFALPRTPWEGRRSLSLQIAMPSTTDLCFHLTSHSEGGNFDRGWVSPFLLHMIESTSSLLLGYIERFWVFWEYLLGFGNATIAVSYQDKLSLIRLRNDQVGTKYIILFLCLSIQN
jgi:hypothetical protein